MEAIAREVAMVKLKGGDIVPSLEVTLQIRAR